jgi:hypothetical protein
VSDEAKQEMTPEQADSIILLIHQTNQLMFFIALVISAIFVPVALTAVIVFRGGYTVKVTKTETEAWVAEKPRVIKARVVR